jgi:hypothetical protein
MAPNRPCRCSSALQVGARWLREWCALAGPTSDAAHDSMPLVVCRVLLACRSSEEVAAELVDLLGDGALDHIAGLLEHRRALAANLRAQIAALREAEAAEKPAMPTYGTTVRCTTSQAQRGLPASQAP